MAKEKSLILAADTSSDILKLALCAPGKTLSRSGASRRQEELLLRFLDSLLGMARAKLSDIGTVAVIRGPGRFTGIRIGLTMAALLARLAGARAVGITVFEALAFQLMGGRGWKKWLAANPGGRLAVVSHAFREEYFVALFLQGPGGRPRQLGEPHWFFRAQLLEFLQKESSASPILCAGSGEKRAPLSQVLQASGLVFAPHKDCLLKIETLAALARLPGKRSLEPLYLKPAKYELS